MSGPLMSGPLMSGPLMSDPLMSDVGRQTDGRGLIGGKISTRSGFSSQMIAQMRPRMTTFSKLAVQVLAAAMLVTSALAQPPSTSSKTDAPRNASRQRTIVGLITGDLATTDAQAASDLATVLNDGNELRILPIIGLGSAHNLADLISLKGVDVAIVHADALSQTSQRNVIRKEGSVYYIAKLFEEEVHVLAGPDVTSLSQLNGKPVNIDVPGSGTELTAHTVLEALHINASLTHESQMVALEQLRRGEISALFLVGGKPAPLLQNLDAGRGLHFVPVPLTTQLIDTYLPIKLEHESYPTLVAMNSPVDTIAVTALLLTVASPTDPTRTKRINKFVDALFERRDQLLQPGHHPKWQEVNLNAQLPGWSRYPEAQARSKKQDQATEDGLRTSFDSYLAQAGQNAAAARNDRRDTLFREFLQWRQAGR